VLERNAYGRGQHRLHPGLLALSRDLGFAVRLCRPYRAKTKGKVERFNRYLRESFYNPLVTRLRSHVPLDATTANVEVLHRRYDRRDTILNVGEAAEGVHVLLAGRAKMVYEDGTGRQMTLGLIGPNDLFGHANLFDDSVCAAGVEALTACETLYMRKRAFLECIEGSFNAAIAILRSTLVRLSRADRTIATLGLLDVHGRVARLLVESAEEIDGQWVVKVGSEEIARSVAASREMVSRVMKRMANAGMLRRHQRRTMILDRALMANRAGTEAH
jgi:CRP/FNR family cyclic AMP-dependent transcriptional regulator